jgi:hypothetical protein
VSISFVSVVRCPDRAETIGRDRIAGSSNQQPISMAESLLLSVR